LGALTGFIFIFYSRNLGLLKVNCQLAADSFFIFSGVARLFGRVWAKPENQFRLRLACLRDYGG
jgi:hypothetical protein